MKKLFVCLTASLFLAQAAFAQEFLKLIKTGTPEEVHDAIAKGARVNDNTTSDGWTPLMIAAEGNENSGVISVLLEAGARLDARDILGWTPLMIAVQSNKNPEIVSVLLRAGANVNDKDFSGMTPLMLAAVNNIPALLSAGARANDKTPDGWTPLMWAIVNVSKAGVNPDPVIASLLKAGANLNEKNKGGLTPLMLAANCGNPEAITALLRAGADGKLKDNSGKTAFDYVAGNEELIGVDLYKVLDKARF